MNAAEKISFEIHEDGNGYGYIYGKFDGKDKVEIAMVTLPNKESVAATIISMITSYKPVADADIATEVKLMAAESEMYRAKHKFESLKRNKIEREKDAENEH